MPFGRSQMLDRAGDRLRSRGGRGDDAGVLGEAFPISSTRSFSAALANCERRIRKASASLTVRLRSVPD